MLIQNVFLIMMKQKCRFAPKHKKFLQDVYKKISNDKESQTVLFTYSASGSCAPPMILYWYEEGIPKKIAQCCPGDWGLGNSESGWMTKECFYEYVT